MSDRLDDRSLDAVARSAADGHRDMTGREPAGCWAAPGRVNLIGEHTDYSDGFVLPMAIDREVVVSASPRRDDVLRVRSLQRQETLEIADLEARSGDLGWAAYPAGMAWALREAGHAVGGADLVIDSSLPAGAGLASSAALECATGRALADLHGIEIGEVELARLAQRAENDFVGMPCGIMDQLAATAGRAGHALFIDVRALSVEPVAFDLASAGLALLVVDTRTRHQLTDGGYADRRAAVEAAAARLGVAALRDVALDTLARSLVVLDDPVLERRARHVVTENARVLRVVDLLAAGRLTEIGQVLTASHVSLREDFQVSCAELDRGVHAALRAGALGARMIGGGFGGALIALLREERCAAVEEAIRAGFSESGFAAPVAFRASSADGARRLAA
ncbi:MAG TPA: galactokinase [Kofleriaceae bacterium]|nr:galactokinase [Kofleriaceae bacterium]